MMKKMMMMMMKMMMVMMMMMMMIMMMKMMIKSMLMTVFLMMYLENFLKQKAKIRIIIGETITTTTIKELIMVLEVNLTVRPVHPLIQVKHFYLRSKMLSTESGG